MTNFLFSFHLPIFSLIDFHVKHNCTCYVTWNYKQHWNMTSMLCLTVQMTVLTQSKDGAYTWHEKHHKTVLRAKRLARSVACLVQNFPTWHGTDNPSTTSSKSSRTQLFDGGLQLFDEAVDGLSLSCQFGEFLYQTRSAPAVLLEA